MTSARRCRSAHYYREVAMKKHWVASAALIFLLIAPASSGNLSIDDLKLPKTDLPQGYDFGKEIMSISIQPCTFYEMPEQSGVVPKPEKKDFQTLEFEGTHRGSLLLFQYKDKHAAERVKSFLSGLLWGDQGGPTNMHPEEMYVFENIILIFCFGYQSDESLLVKNFLRDRKGINLGSQDEQFRQVIATAHAYYNSNDVGKGIEYLKKNYDAIRNYSFGNYFLAEFYYLSHDWVNANRHYAQALGLHNSKNKLPDDGSLWATYHGLGMSCAMTGRVPESVEPFAKSLEIARKKKRGTMIAGSAYDLSCSHAVLTQFAQ